VGFRAGIISSRNDVEADHQNSGSNTGDEEFRVVLSFLWEYAIPKQMTMVHAGLHHL
jgi:hypothetical protein